MTDEPLETTQLLVWLEQMKRGDEAAREELIRRACGQLENLTSKMLKGFPGVRRWADTGDVFQNAILRLLRSLQEVRPSNTAEFFGLAATQVRRELLDLARHYYGPRGLGTNHASEADRSPREPADSGGDPAQLAAHQELHDTIDALPAEQREVVVLRVFQGLTEAEIAAVLGVTTRSVQNYWKRALIRLHALLADAWAE
jgi:RNA polymerase sigma factor (sigma-70 family)